MNPQLKKLHDSRAEMVARCEAITKMDIDDVTDEVTAEFDALMETGIPEVDAKIVAFQKREKQLQSIATSAPAQQGVVLGVAPGSDPSTAVITTNGPGDITSEPAFLSSPTLGFADRMDFLSAIVKDGVTQEYPRAHGELRDERIAYLASGCTDCVSTSDTTKMVPVPRAIASEIMSWDTEEDDSCWKPAIVPMEAKEVDYISICDKNGGLDSYAGAHAYWMNEDSCFKKYESIDFETSTLKAHDLMAGACFTMNSLRDSPRTIAATLDMAIPKVLRKKKRHARLHGTGVGQYLGVYNSPAFLTSAAREVENKVSFMDVIKLSILHADLEGAALFIHPTTMPEFFTMWGDGNSCCNIAYDPVGGCGHGFFQPLGIPIIVSQLAPCLGQCNDVSIINMKYYLEGTYEAPTSRFSDHFMFDCRKRVWQWHQRVAGAPLPSDLITPDRPCAAIGYEFVSPLGVGLGATACTEGAAATLPKPGKNGNAPVQAVVAATSPNADAQAAANAKATAPVVLTPQQKAAQTRAANKEAGK